MTIELSGKQRVLFLNRSYWPDSEATGQLLTSLCESLSSEFDVHVLAGQPNAVTIDEPWEDVACRNGVTIHRVRHLTLPKSNILFKACNFVSFAFVAWFQIVRLPCPDVVVFETDPFLLPFVANRLHRRSGVPMVGYLQDIYPDIAVALGKVRNSWAIRQLRRRMFRVYQQCTKMIVLSSDMRQLLLDSGIDDASVAVIPNWADADAIRSVPEEQNKFVEREKLHGHFVVMYSGNLGLTQRLDHFIEAAGQIEDESIEFVFVGRGATKPMLEKQAQDLQLKNVRFLDYQPRSELAHSLSAADLHVIVLANEVTQCLMPSKLYGILAAGRPYITNARSDSELHRVTVEQDVGIVVEPNSAKSIAAAVREAKAAPERLRKMGAKARALAETKYTFQRSRNAFRDVLTAAAAAGPPAAKGVA